LTGGTNTDIPTWQFPKSLLQKEVCDFSDL